MIYCELLYISDCSIEPESQKIMQTCLNNQLILIKCGFGKFYFDNQECDIYPNQIIVLSPGVFYRVECSINIEYICVGFKGLELPVSPIIATDGGSYSVSILLEIIMQEFENHNIHRKELMNLLLNTILIIIGRLSGNCAEKKDFEKDNFNIITNFMEDKCNASINMEQVAKMSGLSYHRFRHRFKELNGVSPQQYLIKQRINLAKRLLETTSYGTTSIALACGFKSIPQFITCFNRQEGVTPMKYRRQSMCKKQVPFT